MEVGYGEGVGRGSGVPGEGSGVQQPGVNARVWRVWREWQVKVLQKVIQKLSATQYGIKGGGPSKFIGSSSTN